LQNRFQDELRVTRRELEEFRQKNNELIKEKSEISDAVNILNNEFSEMKSSFEKERMKFEGKIASLKKMLTEKEIELKEQTDSLISKIGNLEEELHKSVIQNTTRQEEIERNVAHIEYLKSVINEETEESRQLG
jgi:predicted  nucleic acid-binding Zn-ribbon protein